MDFEVIFWTAFFFGGDILAIILLTLRAARPGRETESAPREER